MIRVEEAAAIIQSHLLHTAVEEVQLLHSAGRTLAEPIQADRDLPPFDRVAMDGIAIHTDFFSGAGQSFTIETIQAAGHEQQQLKDKTKCIEVMTGAVLPLNSNAVVRYEDIILKEGSAMVQVASVKAGQNIHKQASDARRGDTLLHPGQKISPAEIALLASVGKEMVKVSAFPTTAVVSSGDELVDVNSTPLPHQIRKSNTYALQSAMALLGWPSERFHLADDKKIIKASLQKILIENDVLILSGGVSKGKFDFIPEVLEGLDIQKRFHQVSQRPGKPFWFGVSKNHNKVVFALPGNPVSAFVCFYKYIKPWIVKCTGSEQPTMNATLASDLSFAPNLTYFLQVRTSFDQGRLLAHPIPGGGSGDFANLREVDGFLELPAEKSAFKSGETYPFISFRD